MTGGVAGRSKAGPSRRQAGRRTVSSSPGPVEGATIPVRNLIAMFTRTASERRRAEARRSRYAPRPPRPSLREVPPDVRADLARHSWPAPGAHLR